MKKMRVVQLLMGVSLVVALGIHHFAFSQSGNYITTWAQAAWSNALQSPIAPAILKTKTPATVPESENLSDPSGQIGSYQVNGPTTTSENAFFATLGSNQRTCFSCHQPQDGWALTARTVQSVYQSTNGKDALFQPVDGSNCPNLGAAAVTPGAAFIAARSQLFTKANIRIFIPVPTKHDWESLTVVNDPYGCENSHTYGLPSGFISMYRRPLPSANLFFLDPAGTVVPAPPNPPLPPIPGLSGTSPEGTGFAIMWDSREPDLTTQFQDAVRIHAQGSPAQLAALTADLIQQGVNFQQGIFTAQSYDNNALDLTGRSDRSGANGGPVFLASQSCGSDISFCLPVAPTFLGAVQFTVYPPTFVAPGGTEEAMRASILRGQAIFNGGARFIVNGVSGFNDLLGPNFKATCNTCHNVQNVGNNFVLGPLHTGIGDNSYVSPLQAPAGGVPPLPPTPDLPLFSFLCPSGSIPFFTNPVTVSGTTYDLLETTDPGTGLISGKCADLGKMKTPMLRGLASRAPYFHGGNASSLQNLVNFYNKRFNIGLTAQQQTDLVNFLNTL